MHDTPQVLGPAVASVRQLSGTDRVRLCWTRSTLASKFCRFPGIARSDGKGRGRNSKLSFAWAPSLVNPSFYTYEVKLLNKNDKEPVKRMLAQYEP